MSRRSGVTPDPINLEIERLCRENRRRAREASTSNPGILGAIEPIEGEPIRLLPNMDGNLENREEQQGMNQVEENPPFVNHDENAYRRGRQEVPVNVEPLNERKPLRDYCTPNIHHAVSGIVLPNIDANQYEIKTGLIQLVQQNPFFGRANEDPNDHLTNFMQVCETFRHTGLRDETVKLMVFPFSLRDQAKTWLNSLLPRSINTWDELAQKFLAKFYPPSKTARYRNEIMSFRQDDLESLTEAWERYKGLLRICPHHGVPNWLVIQSFYKELIVNHRTLIDGTSGGALLRKTYDEVYDLIEEMTLNECRWPSEQQRGVSRGLTKDSDPIKALYSQITELNKRVLNLVAVKTTQAPPPPPPPLTQPHPLDVCNSCGGNDHAMRDNCVWGNPYVQSEECNYVGNN